MKNIVKILSIQQVTPDVKCFRFEKPAGYQFLPGQATDVSINKPGMEDELIKGRYAKFSTTFKSAKNIDKVNHSDNKGEAFSPLFKIFSINFTATHIVAHREIAYGL